MEARINCRQSHQCFGFKFPRFNLHRKIENRINASFRKRRQTLRINCWYNLIRMQYALGQHVDDSLEVPCRRRCIAVV